MMGTEPLQFVDILMVEDSQVDVLMTREALKQARLVNTLHIVEDGVQAMQFLRQEAEFASSPRSDLILTTSQAEQDILDAYDLQANCYIVKPVGFENFVIVVQSIQSFWFGVGTLP